MAQSQTTWGAEPGTPEYRQQIALGETNYKVDIDTPPGAQIRFTPDGMAVYMRYAEPGVFLNDHGRKVPEVLAREAGFDTEYWGKIRRREAAKAETLEQINREYEMGLGKRVVWERGEYRVVEVAPGYYNIEFDDGTILNTRGPVSLEVAQRRFEELTGEPIPAPAPSSQPDDEGVEKAGPKRAK